MPARSLARWVAAWARVAALIASVALTGLGLTFRLPMFASNRFVLAPAGVIAAAALAIAFAWIALRGREPKRRRLAAVVAIAAALALAAFAWTEWKFRRSYADIFAAPRAELAAVGRHVIVGYRDLSEVKRLVAAGAVGGVFVTARNAQGKSTSELAAEIASLQALAAANGHPRLIVTTDQEGGMVSRLSPPLPRPPALASVIAGKPDAAARKLAARDAGRAAGRDLAAVGVTLNLAPVADVDFGIRNPADRYSRIGERAISTDPVIVAEVAGAWCAGLADAGVRCTLKHFPGLGRAREDTHVASAKLDVTLDALRDADWVPFRRAAAEGNAAIMVGHVGIAGVDGGRPASTSRALVTGVLREEWKFGGFVITDDLTMAAIAGRPEGIGTGAVASLAAGADLLLVSFDTDQVYDVIASLLRARATGDLSAAVLASSEGRLGLARK